MGSSHKQFDYQVKKNNNKKKIKTDIAKNRHTAVEQVAKWHPLEMDKNG